MPLTQQDNLEEHNTLYIVFQIISFHICAKIIKKMYRSPTANIIKYFQKIKNQAKKFMLVIGNFNAKSQRTHAKNTKVLLMLNYCIISTKPMLFNNKITFKCNNSVSNIDVTNIIVTNL